MEQKSVPGRFFVSVSLPVCCLLLVRLSLKMDVRSYYKSAQLPAQCPHSRTQLDSTSSLTSCCCSALVVVEIYRWLNTNGWTTFMYVRLVRVTIMEMQELT
jgi:hypothetical protein